jgi:hypothetical protein
LNLLSFPVALHTVSSCVDITNRSLYAPRDLFPRRAWIRRPHFFNSLERFSRVHTSHCLGLSSSLPRTKVGSVNPRICVAHHHSYLTNQTSTTKQDVEYPTSPTHLNAFASSKSRSGRKMHPLRIFQDHQHLAGVRMQAVRKGQRR